MTSPVRGLALRHGAGSPASPAYRDDLEGARLRYADLRSRTVDGSALPGMESVYARRTGRIWAGSFGIGGFALTAFAAAASAFSRDLSGLSPSFFLAASWPAVAAAYVLGSAVGARRFRRLAMPAETGDLHADLARLEDAIPVEDARELAAYLERSSVALPMIAFALLMPLTLHGFYFMVVSDHVGGFDEWIRMSLVIVGHAHLALAFMGWRFAREAARMGNDELARRRSGLQWTAFGVAVLTSAIPGIVLFAIPPILTAITGIVFNPVVYLLMTSAILAERRALS